jgi:hypothetical protein
MWFVFSLLIIFIMAGIFVDLFYRLEKAPKPESKYIQIVQWSLIVIFYIAIIYWIRTW